MTKKITLFVSTALLLTLLCGMAMKPIMVSAYISPNECNHLTNRTFLGSSDSYPDVTPNTHHRISTVKYHCNSCNSYITMIEDVSEPHTFNSFLKCTNCGYEWH